MKFLWFDINISRKAHKKDDSFVNSMTSGGFSYIWNTLNACWEIEFSLNTFYEIQNYITEAQAYKNKIVNWVGNNWMYIIDSNNKIIKNDKLLSNIIDTFSDPTFKLFKERYFTHHFCSWDIYLYRKTNMLNDITAQVVDSRTIKKKIDNKWNIISYEQRWINGKVNNISVEDMYNSIVRFNSDNPFYWASLYQGILYDAMADKETSRRNFYFFKNNAVPNIIFMLNPEFTNKEEIKLFEEDIKKKYQWAENSSKFMLSNAITDAKVLDINNKDLDLIQMREFFIKKMAIVFQIDPRIIGYITESWADRSITSIRAEAKETLNVLSNQLETDMNKFYKEFVDKKFQYKIKLDSETFEDVNEISENQRKDVVLWLVTVNEIRRERWLDEYKEEWSKKPILQSNLDTDIDNRTKTDI